MRSFYAPWRYPADERSSLGNARMTFVKPFVNGLPTRYFMMLDLVRSQGPMSRREIVARSFGEDSQMCHCIRKWDNVSYGDYFTAFTQAGLLDYNRKTRLWEAGPALQLWYTEVVFPYLSEHDIHIKLDPNFNRTLIGVKVEKPEPQLTTELSTEQRLAILYSATREKMKKLLDERAELDDEIKTVDRVLTAIETINTFFPKMED